VNGSSSRCSGCGVDSPKNIYLVACGSEYCRPSSAAAWEKADVWVVDLAVCHRCILAVCERYLGAELKSCGRGLIQSLGALVGMVLFVVVADTGAFKGLGSASLFIAIVGAGIFLYGLFGLPYYSYRAIKTFAQRALSRSGNPLKGDDLQAAIQFEAARLLAAGQLKRVQSKGESVVSSMPEGHSHRETVLAIAGDYSALVTKTPQEWQSWLKRRIPSVISN
jgi:hypothetical protein